MHPKHIKIILAKCPNLWFSFVLLSTTPSHQDGRKPLVICFAPQGAIEYEHISPWGLPFREQDKNNLLPNLWAPFVSASVSQVTNSDSSRCVSALFADQILLAPVIYCMTCLLASPANFPWVAEICFHSWLPPDFVAPLVSDFILSCHRASCSLLGPDPNDNLLLSSISKSELRNRPARLTEVC